MEVTLRNTALLREVEVKVMPTPGYAGPAPTVNWGDGGPLENVTGPTKTHTYAKDGFYRVEVKADATSVRHATILTGDPGAAAGAYFQDGEVLGREYFTLVSMTSQLG
jgi:hypothetical protein